MLGALEQASFKYYADGISYTEWKDAVLPDWVELRWLEGDRLTRWRFVTKQ